MQNADTEVSHKELSIDSFKRAIFRLLSWVPVKEIHDIVNETAAIHASQQEAMDVLLLPNSTTFIPKKISEILADYEKALVISCCEPMESHKRFLQAHCIVRDKDSDVFRKIIDIRPQIIVLNNCLYGQPDSLLTVVREIAKSLESTLLILMQIGCIDPGVVNASRTVWIPPLPRVSPSLRHIIECKQREYVHE